MRELASKRQGIIISGVGAHQHNGAAESAIKIVVYKAQSMVIHDSIC